MSSCKVHTLLARFESNWIFYKFSRNLKMTNFMKILPVRAELLLGDR